MILMTATGVYWEIDHVDSQTGAVALCTSGKQPIWVATDQDEAGLFAYDLYDEILKPEEVAHSIGLQTMQALKSDQPAQIGDRVYRDYMDWCNHLLLYPEEILATSDKCCHAAWLAFTVDDPLVPLVQELIEEGADTNYQEFDLVCRMFQEVPIPDRAQVIEVVCYLEEVMEDEEEG